MANEATEPKTVLEDNSVEKAPLYLTDKVPTLKARFLDPEDGNAIDVFFYASTTPDEMEALFTNALEMGNIARGLGLLSANQVAGRRAAEEAKAPKFDLKFDTNKLFHCVFMNVLPQPGGKVKVEFYGDGFKQPHDDYPSLVNTMPGEWLVNYLEAFGDSIDPQIDKFAESYTTDFWVEWYESDKINTSGKPYKNISQIHVEDGALAPEPAKAHTPPKREESVTKPEDIPF